MRVLLTDGSGLTSRQVANRLFASGHVVEALTPDPFCICRFTRHVHRLRRVPAYGSDPFAWLEVALAAYGAGEFDVLFPTQEQVAVLASVPNRLQATGVVTAVPPWTALLAVQDKVSAFTTLQRLGVPQPPASTEPAGWDAYPAFVKIPIGTASGGVTRVVSAAELARACSGHPHVLVQLAVAGPLAMCQSVFDHGSLVAFHANLRTGEGANGGASHKSSIALLEARDAVELLGRDLRWHGALSADVIVTSKGPQFIDINPRLVEPENAWRAGVDLVGTFLAVARGSRPSPAPQSRDGVKTHQLLLAVLGSAQRGDGRGALLRELGTAWRHSGAYRGSAEELTPARRDPLGILPVALASLATLVRPASWSWFTSGSVENYALSPKGWEQIVSAAGKDG